jgi:hypothetical protein
MIRSVAVLLLATVAVALATSGPYEPDCYYERTFDGSCNNVAHPAWGSSDSYLLRGAEGFRYVDGVREPVLEPNVRTVSNALFRGDDTILSPFNHNLLWTFFGQFVTHDLLGVHRKGDLNASEIPDSNNSNIWIRVDIDPSDPLYSVLRPDLPWMRIIRSRGEMVNGVFEIGSESTSFLDLDVVYGKHANVAAMLRQGSGGLLKHAIVTNYTRYPGSSSNVPESQKGEFGEWLPLFADVDPARTTVPLSNQLVVASTLNINYRAHAAGDGRNDENYALQVIQGLFLREHNRIARQLAAANPNLSDDELYARARRLNIAQYQAVVMYEWLPSVLLADYSRVGRYQGYRPSVNPTTTHLFAFALRFGHTTVPNAFFLRDQCNQRPFNSTRDGPRSGQSFAREMGADQMAQVGTPENILHALLYTTGGKVDVQFPESLRTLRGAVSDVIAQNQMRAAENGLPGYNDIRKVWHGAPFPSVYNWPFCNADETTPSPDPIACFLLINSNYTIASTLQSLYGKVNNINFYTAVVAEEPRHAVVGQTSSRIIADQFARSRDGDRWWFEGDEAGFTPLEKRSLRLNMRMKTLLQRNFPTAHVQNDAFYSPEDEFFSSC